MERIVDFLAFLGGHFQRLGTWRSLLIEFISLFVIYVLILIFLNVIYSLYLRRLTRKLDKLKIQSAEFKLKLSSAGTEPAVENPYEEMIATVEASIKAGKKEKTCSPSTAWCFTLILLGIFCGVGFIACLLE